MIPALPPLNFNQSSQSGLNGGGSTFMASGPGDWNVNLSGSGAATQGISAGGIPSWMLVGAALVAVYLVTRK